MTTTKYVFGKFSTFGGSYDINPDLHKHLAYLVYGRVGKRCRTTYCTVYKLRNMSMEIGNYEFAIKTTPVDCELHPRYAKITEINEEISTNEFPMIGEMHDKFDRVAVSYDNVTFYTDTYTDSYDEVSVIHWIQQDGENSKLFNLILSTLESSD